eukprot:m.255259 g.255259  ORF g.255259 m.255259 type:complete len:73 (+) comp11011_c0_seq9:2623-2841(+)
MRHFRGQVLKRAGREFRDLVGGMTFSRLLDLCEQDEHNLLTQDELLELTSLKQTLQVALDACGFHRGIHCFL